MAKSKKNKFILKGYELSSEIIKDEVELRKPCSPVALSEVSFLHKKLFPEINKIMQDNEGCGLASVQVGIHKTFFIIDLVNKTGSYTGAKLFINPRIIYYSPNKDIREEGCLSFPGKREKIERSLTIGIEYFGYKDGKVGLIKEIYIDFNARVIQHEYDHLQGILCLIDKAIKIADVKEGAE